MNFDLIVIGSGPGGQKAAIAAAKLGKRVALIERAKELVGGVCLHTGTVPSKTIREAILHLTGFRQRDVYVEQYLHKRQVTMDDLRRKLAQVGNSEWRVIQDQFERNGIQLFVGTASLCGPHEVAIQTRVERRVLRGEIIILAPGTRPARPAHIPFDGRRVFDSDELLNLQHIPRSMIVVGAGVIGMEYALMFATLGVEVTVIDGRDRLLEFCDHEIVDVLIHHGRSQGISFRLGEKVSQISTGEDRPVLVELESGKRLLAETVLFSVGREGDTESLHLEAAGLQTDSRGRLTCNEFFQTEQPHIYAIGDIVGFPALASASMQQGRLAAGHAFGQPCSPCRFLPYGLFTIPEISMVGANEQELTAKKVPYEVGTARFREIARGHIVGDTSGLLKLLFQRQTRQILGVHCIGESATEIVHIGQAVMALGGTVEYFRDNVFNYPTMSECYKVAALDGLNKLRWHQLAAGPAERPAAALPITNVDACWTPVPVLVG